LVDTRTWRASKLLPDGNQAWYAHGLIYVWRTRRHQQDLTAYTPDGRVKYQRRADGAFDISAGYLVERGFEVDSSDAAPGRRLDALSGKPIGPRVTMHAPLQLLPWSVAGG
jgi:hypothetical protein